MTPSSFHGTSASAAATAEAVPFHCIICFDEFSLVEKPPVILPCGHTYVCSPCSKRLSKCMECRMPLVWNTPPPPKPTSCSKFGNLGLSANNNNSRYRSLPQLHPRPPSPIPHEHATQQSVQMPKNLVLMALMESSQRITQEKEEESNRILVGIEAMSGTCGTYAVRQLDGLAVLPRDPRRRHSVGSCCNDEQQEDESHEDICKSKSASEAEPLSPSCALLREPYTIERGQTVQVVRLQDGIAQLARNEGHILVSTSQQLVKVGGPQEKSCQLEGMLDLVEVQKRELEQKLQEVEALKRELKEQLQAEQAKDEPDHPVITPVPEHLKLTSSQESETSSCSSLSPIRSKPSNDDNTVCTTPPQSESSMEHHALVPPHTIDNSDLCNDQKQFFDYSCSSTLFAQGILAVSDENSHQQQPETTNRRLQAPTLVAPSPSFDSSLSTIDWRTGLSGHRALLSVKIGSTPAYRGEVRMMSEHNGIARVRRPIRRVAQS